MPTTTLKPIRVTKLPIKQNNLPHIQYEYRVKKAYTNQQIKNVAEAVKKNIKSKIKGKQLGAKIMITNLYDKSIFWQSGRFTDVQQDDLDFYDFENEYEYKGDAIQDTFRKFNFLVKLYPLAGGCDGNMNDCLWYCLRDLFNGEAYLPKSIATPGKLKRLLGVGRLAPVPCKLLPKLEDEIKVNINVSGDVDATSSKAHPRKADVKLRAGHYTVDHVHKMDPQLRQTTNNKDKKLAVYREVYAGKCLMYEVCSDKGLATVSREHMDEFWKKPLSHAYIYRRAECDATPLHEQLVALIADANILKDHTKGLINMHRVLNDKGAALFAFGKLSRMFDPPQPIGTAEAVWIKHAKSGGLIYAANGTKLDCGWSYDLNKMYSGMLSSAKFTVPCAVGVPKHMQKLPDAYVPYGIYKCRITNPKGVDTRLFRMPKKETAFVCNTHFDLTTARELGLQIELADGVNCLLFSAGRKTASHLFKPFVDLMYDVHVKTGGMKRCKKIMNCLWGGLAETNRQKLDTTKCEELNLQDHDVVHVEPHDDGHLVLMESYSQPFKTNHARIAPFLTAFARRHMFLMLQPFTEHVFRIHTDGFVSDKQLPELKMSNKIGDWKLEHKGPCTIHNKCKVEWHPHVINL